MAKKNLLPDAENMFVNEARTIDEIAAKLNISNKTVWSWIQQYKWSEKRAILTQARTRSHAAMYSLALELINSIIEDIAEKKEPSAQRVQLLCKLWDMIPKALKYEEETNQEVKQTAVSDENKTNEVLGTVKKVLGIEE